MAATAEQIGRLRRQVGEPTTTTYSDATLAGYIERYPRVDELGELPYTWDVSTEPPTQVANDDWLPTYDLAAAAADVWTEKAALLSANFDFSADGGNYSRSQAYEQAMKQARYWASRRLPGTIRVHVHPQPLPFERTGTPAWLANAPELE